MDSLKHSSEVGGQHKIARFLRSTQKKKKARVKACVLSALLLMLFNAVSLLCSAAMKYILSFLTLNTAAEATNQHLHITTSEERNGYCFDETLK